MKGLLSRLPVTEGKTGWPWTTETDPDLYKHRNYWPNISIVTPSFNQGNYIEETIRSVILQNYPNLEYVIIDGGSSDDTLQVIKKYEKWINVWISEKDNGQADAINKGLGYLSGELFNWINSDDLLSEEALYHIAVNYHQNDVVAGKVCIFSDGAAHTDGNANLIRFAEIGSGNIGYLQPACWIKLSDLRKKGNLRSDLHYLFDYEMMIRIVGKTSRIKYVDRVLAHFRLHEESKTVSQSIQFFIERNKIYGELLKSAYDNNDHDGISRALIALSNDSLQQYLSYTSRLAGKPKSGGGMGLKPFLEAFLQLTTLYFKKIRFIVSGYLRVALSIPSRRNNG